MIIMKWSKFNVLFYSKKLGYCLFNSRMLSLTKLDKNTFELFTLLQSKPELAECKLCESDYKCLVQKKILVNDTEDQRYQAMLKYRKMSQSYSHDTLGLIVCPTLACNFACPYCYEHNLPNLVMKESVQQQLIDFINRQEGYKKFTLNWHGGEPLMAFKTIQQIYEKIETKAHLPLVHSSMVSNGFLLTEEMCKFFSNVKLNYLQITIDGAKETHNKTRILKNGESSFERIIENIDMATEIMPDCCIGIRTNIGKNNRSEYIKLYRDLSERWRDKNCHIYHTYILDNGLDLCEENRSSLELTTDEKNDFEVLLAQAGIKSKKSLYPCLDKCTYTCTDQSAFVVDPLGSLYKCWADVGKSNRTIGHLKTGIDNYDIVSQFLLSTDKFTDSRCLQCSYLPVCDGGCNLYRVGYLEKGIPYNVCQINDRGLIKYLETYCEEL